MDQKDLRLIVRVIRNVPIPQTNRARLIDKFVEELKAENHRFEETKFRIQCTKEWDPR